MLDAKTFGTLLLCYVAVVNGQTACDTNNGGCSVQCIDRGNGQVQCGCPCGTQLAADNTSCVPLFACNLDIYMAIDRSRTIDPLGCRTTSATFNNWKLVVDSVLKDFEPLSTAAEINVGVQIYTRQFASSTVTAANYFPPNISNAIALYASYDKPDCGSAGSYFIHLALAGEFSPSSEKNNATFTPNGPSGLRSTFNTSRVAIALVLRPDFFISDNRILDIRKDIVANFDSIVVITKTNVLFGFGNEERNTRQARLLACGSTAANCPKVFWVDRVNDVGLPFNIPSFMSVIDRNACVFRRPGAPRTEAVITSCDNQMVFKIPLCALRGLNANDLSFYGSTCSVGSYSVVVDGYIVVTLPYGSCGMTQEFVDVDGVVRNRYTSRVVNKASAVPVHVYGVNIAVTCTLGTLADPVTLSLQPAEQTVTQNRTDYGTFPFAMNLFATDNFQIPIISPATIKVGCTVYLEAISVFPQNLFLSLWCCWATPSPDPYNRKHHYLASSGCPRDSTFKILPSPLNILFRASFDMFQFACGYKQPKEQKPRIYVHCTFVVRHVDGYTAPTCNPNLPPGRSRREVTDDNMGSSVTKTVGPFIVDNSDNEELRKIDETSQLPEVPEQAVKNNANGPSEISRRMEVVIPVSGLSINLIMYWTIWVLLISLLVYVVWTERQSFMHLHNNTLYAVPYQHLYDGARYAGKFFRKSEQEKAGFNRSAPPETLPPCKE